MEWYFRYPLVVLFGFGYSMFERAGRLLPLSETILPSTAGDFVSLAAFMCAATVGGVLAIGRG